MSAMKQSQAQSLALRGGGDVSKVLCDYYFDYVLVCVSSANNFRVMFCSHKNPFPA